MRCWPWRGPSCSPGLAYRGGEPATLTGPVLNLTVWALLALVAVRFLFRWDPRR
ncbi:hypothetical protein OG320_09455 [Microbispora sp. NBC_01189]|uniref:hypothetical protein n=1 Tax=Microbispora sp. NBC_01189 TaxID=2903583 RepID=UPI002E0FF9BC|nr:hypothetical protein OG320_09455 [Microbispora sp. NBC_01189]